MPLTEEDKAFRLDHSTQGARLIQEDGDIVNEADTIDESVKARKTVNEMQSAIHAGKAYALAGYGTIASGAKKFILMKTGVNPVHFMDAFFEFEIGDFLVYVMESPTISANGTVLSGKNMNRIRPLGVATAIPYADPTVTAEGTDIGASFKVMPTSKVPASGALANGRVLEPNRDYLMVISNLNSTGTHAFSYALTWHEL